MPSYLLDTNVLLQPLRSEDGVRENYLRYFSDITRNHSVFINGQILREAWSVLTRPAESNGYGFTSPEAHELCTQWQRAFQWIGPARNQDTIWLDLVLTYNVKGRRCHDASLVASALAHGLDGIVTLNGKDFAMFKNLHIWVLPPVKDAD